MAYATQVTISTGNKVTFNYQSREVGIALTYCLESQDTDVLQVVKEKAMEVARAHQVAWQKMRDEKATQKRSTRSNGKAAPAIAAQQSMVERAAVEGTVIAPQTSQQPVQNEVVGEVGAESEEEPSVFQPASEAQRKAIYALFSASSLTDEEFEALLQERFGWSTVEELSDRQASSLLVELQRSERERLARQRNDKRRLMAAKNS